MVSISNANQLRDDLVPALADPTRRRILELVAGRPMTASEIHGAFPLAPPAVSRHLRVLREAGLIRELPVTDRRVRLYTLSPETLTPLTSWVGQLSTTWQAQLDSFKDYVALRSGRPAGHGKPAAESKANPNPNQTR
jgi:DNA-binding transcriptional ArsR family regulator